MLVPASNALFFYTVSQLRAVHISMSTSGLVSFAIRALCCPRQIVHARTLLYWFRSLYYAAHNPGVIEIILKHGSDLDRVEAVSVAEYLNVNNVIAKSSPLSHQYADNCRLEFQLLSVPYWDNISHFSAQAYN